MNAQETIRQAYDYWSRAGEVLNKFNRQAEVDEIALYFGTTDQLDEFVRRAERFAPQFNMVLRDTMMRQDTQEQFEVQFRFLQPIGLPFRLECMAIWEGTAPLHRARLAAAGSPCVIHASYKVADEEQYDREKRRMSGDRPLMKFAAEYRNSYGVFSYWRDTTLKMTGCYLKPRANLRDIVS